MASIASNSPPRALRFDPNNPRWHSARPLAPGPVSCLPQPVQSSSQPALLAASGAPTLLLEFGRALPIHPGHPFPEFLATCVVKSAESTLWGGAFNVFSPWDDHRLQLSYPHVVTLRTEYQFRCFWDPVTMSNAWLKFWFPEIVSSSALHWNRPHLLPHFHTLPFTCPTLNLCASPSCFPSTPTLAERSHAHHRCRSQPLTQSIYPPWNSFPNLPHPTEEISALSTYDLPHESSFLRQLTLPPLEWTGGRPNSNI